MKSKYVYILGINDGHNATASLLRDGEIIASVSEERFNGLKNYIGFPEKSIEWVLKSASITARDLSVVTYPRLYVIPAFTRMEGVSDQQTQKSSADIIRKYWANKETIEDFLYNTRIFQKPFRRLHDYVYKTVGAYTAGQINARTAELLNISPDKIRLFSHHDCHAAASYFSSPFRKNTLIFTLDGEGDFISSTVSIGRGNNLTRITYTGTTSTLSYLYMEATGYLGMKRNEHEYKVMGMAPYAKKSDVLKLIPELEKVIWLSPENHLTFGSAFDTHLAGSYLRKKMKEIRFDTLSGAIQLFSEDLLTSWIMQAVRKTGFRNICLGGGVFMNVKVNQKIAALPEVNDIFPMPSSGDESNAIGACYLAYLNYMKNHGQKPVTKPVSTLYLGPDFDNSEILRSLKSKSSKYTFRYYRNIEKEIAKLLKKHEIVARFKGRMEYGARALGNRSILAHPSDYTVTKILNDSMKMRDFWMPFAPSILDKYADKYIYNPKKINASYMMITFDSTPLAQKHLGAAMHPYDGSLRPQIVKKADNPSYYSLIEEFYKLTGIGAVLNTSFNLHGYPIVMSPDNALDAFAKSGLKYLAMGNYLIWKS